jgi:hypothetical protein
MLSVCAGVRQEDEAKFLYLQSLRHHNSNVEIDTIATFLLLRITCSQKYICRKNTIRLYE